MNLKRHTLSIIGAAALGLTSLSASAISTVGNCDVNDVTATGSGSAVAADACYGLVAGNVSSDPGASYYENLIPDSAFGGAFAGNDWQLRAISFDTTTHTWSGDLSGFNELIIVLKQSTLWGAWYFNPADSFGTWSTIWDYPNGKDNQGGGLSHGFALVRGTAQVPEPATLGLLGLGALAAGFAARRRRRA